MEKEVSEAGLRLNVRSKYLEKVTSTIGKDFIEQHELYSLVRGFFSEFLKLEYEFTYEELSADLNKIFIKPGAKKDIDTFLYELSESEYLFDRELEQEEIKNYLKRFKSMVEGLISDTIEDRKKSTFLGKIFGKSTDQKDIPENPNDQKDVPEKPDGQKNALEKPKVAESISELPPLRSEDIILPQIIIQPETEKEVKDNVEVEKPDPNPVVKKEVLWPVHEQVLIEDEDSDIINIRELMEEAYFHVYYKNFDGAKGKYLTALDIYHKLSMEDKKKVYMQLYELFNKLKGMG